MLVAPNGPECLKQAQDVASEVHKPVDSEFLKNFIRAAGKTYPQGIRLSQSMTECFSMFEVGGVGSTYDRHGTWTIGKGLGEVLRALRRTAHDGVDAAGRQ